MIGIMDQTIGDDLKKAQPLCPHFGDCGGCAYQDLHYSDELQLKEKFLRDLLGATMPISENSWRPIVPSPKQYHYRHRIDLKLQRTKNGTLIGFTPKEGVGIIPVVNCAIAMESINERIPQIKTEALAKITEKHRLANLTIRTGSVGPVRWGGIGKHSMRMKEEEYFSTEINGRRLYFALETFFQANLSILPALIDEIRQLPIWSAQTRLFDLYGGVGLFSMNLYDLVKEAFLIEQVGASVVLARFNQVRLNAANVHILEGDVEEILPPLLGSTPGQDVAIIDPPRAGLSERAIQLFTGANAFRHLLYLSCNPLSLQRDLDLLIKEGWTLERIQPFDFFPKTKHIETLVLMERTYGKK